MPPRQSTRHAMNALIARAPTRLDFGGGWTDVPPYSEEEGGFVCNIAIARYATVRLSRGRSGEGSIDTRRATDTALAEAAVRRAGIRDITIEITSDFPLGAGLGGSSAAGVAVNGALAAWRGDADRSSRARGTESRDRSARTSASPADDRTTTRPRTVARWRSRSATRRASGDCRCRRALKASLERRCIVVYTGQSRISGDTITAVLDAYRDRNRARAAGARPDEGARPRDGRRVMRTGRRRTRRARLGALAISAIAAPVDSHAAHRLDSGACARRRRTRRQGARRVGRRMRA